MHRGSYCWLRCLSFFSPSINSKHCVCVCEEETSWGRSSGAFYHWPALYDGKRVVAGWTAQLFNKVPAQHSRRETSQLCVYLNMTLPPTYSKYNTPRGITTSKPRQISAAGLQNHRAGDQIGWVACVTNPSNLGSCKLRNILQNIKRCVLQCWILESVL